MTREYIEDQMKEILRISKQEFQTFYLRCTSGGGSIITNKWGEMQKFEKALEEVENSSDRVGDSLPIELLVLINNQCVYCWTKNPLWNSVDYPEEVSHVYTNVPLIGKHWFVDPKYWLDIDNNEYERKLLMSDGD